MKFNDRLKKFKGIISLDVQKTIPNDYSLSLNSSTPIKKCYVIDKTIKTVIIYYHKLPPDELKNLEAII